MSGEDLSEKRRLKREWERISKVVRDFVNMKGSSCPIHIVLMSNSQPVVRGQKAHWELPKGFSLRGLPTGLIAVYAKKYYKKSTLEINVGDNWLKIRMELLVNTPREIVSDYVKEKLGSY